MAEKEGMQKIKYQLDHSFSTSPTQKNPFTLSGGKCYSKIHMYKSNIDQEAQVLIHKDPGALSLHSVWALMLTPAEHRCDSNPTRATTKTI